MSREVANTLVRLSSLAGIVMSAVIICTSAPIAFDGSEYAQISGAVTAVCGVFCLLEGLLGMNMLGSGDSYLAAAWLLAFGAACACAGFVIAAANNAVSDSNIGVIWLSLITPIRGCSLRAVGCAFSKDSLV